LFAVLINTDAATAATSTIAMKMIIVPTPISARLSFFQDVLIFMFLSPIIVAKRARVHQVDIACRQD